MRVGRKKRKKGADPTARLPKSKPVLRYLGSYSKFQVQSAAVAGRESKGLPSDGGGADREHGEAEASREEAGAGEGEGGRAKRESPDGGESGGDN